MKITFDAIVTAVGGGRVEVKLGDERILSFRATEDQEQQAGRLLYRYSAGVKLTLDLPDP